MGVEQVLAALDAVERTALALCEAADGMTVLIGEARRSLDEMTLAEAVDRLFGNGTVARGGVQRAWENHEHAFMMLRVGVIRSLVDDAGWTLSEVGRRLHVSRQKVSKLYRRQEMAGIRSR